MKLKKTLKHMGNVFTKIVKKSIFSKEETHFISLKDFVLY